MKNFLIFLSIFTIALIAFYDAKERFAELDEVASKTPAQVEMKPQINTKEHSSHSLQMQKYSQNDYNNQSHHQNHLQNSIDDMNKRNNEKKQNR